MNPPTAPDPVFHGDAAAPATGSAQAWLSVGRTWHRRLRPVDRVFSYPVLFLWLPMRALAARPQDTPLPRNRAGAIAFYDRDHGAGGPDALAWIDQLLQAEGLVADGEIWLQTLPRVFGYAFKPVSFWYAHARDGQLRAVVAEVNNTFGERHVYLLPVVGPAAGNTAAFRFQAEAQKVFHVSPFCAVRGTYAFRFSGHGNWRSARVDLNDTDGPLLHTALSGRLVPFRTRTVWATFVRMPFAAFAVVWRIHWQALLLWLQRLPFFRQPAAPAHGVTRSLTTDPTC